jgi:hypothetical protein
MYSVSTSGDSNQKYSRPESYALKEHIYDFGGCNQEFLSMTNGVLRHLSNLGYDVQPKEREYDDPIAFRRSLHFPQLLFSLQISGYRNAQCRSPLMTYSAR